MVYNNYLIGCHLPSANLFKSVDEVNAYGVNFMQIFVTNPMGKAGKESLTKYKSISQQIKSYCSNNSLKLVYILFFHYMVEK